MGVLVGVVVDIVVVDDDDDAGDMVTGVIGIVLVPFIHGFVLLLFHVSSFQKTESSLRDGEGKGEGVGVGGSVDEVESQVEEPWWLLFGLRRSDRRVLRRDAMPVCCFPVVRMERG